MNGSEDRRSGRSRQQDRARTSICNKTRETPAEEEEEEEEEEVLRAASGRWVVSS
jgi:hypothetical protein